MTQTCSNLRIGPAEPLCSCSSSSPPGNGEQTLPSAASILKDALLSHFGSNVSAASNDGGGGDDGAVLVVDNKYFTAQVALEDLWVVAPPSDGGADSASDGRASNRHRSEDGIILAFRDGGGGDATAQPQQQQGAATATAPLDALASIHSAAQALNQAGDMLRLLVAVTTSGPIPTKSTKEAEAEYSRRVLWCLDRGYEYVEADLSDEGVKAGHEDRDKDGFARVVEAVGGTVWSGAVNKPRAPRGGAAATAAAAAASPSSAAGSTEPTGAGGGDSAPSPPSRNTAMAAVGAVDPSANAFVLPPEPNPPIERDDGDNDGAAATTAQGDGQQQQDQYVFDDLEKIMSEASRIRSQARDGQLSDEERRARASDAAVALMGVLDRMGFDDDDDDDSDSDRSNGGDR